jgi:4-aminobutyrate---pyruvate transaminase
MPFVQILMTDSSFQVITAFGRLGTMFGCDMFNIKPDLVSFAKVSFQCFCTCDLWSSSAIERIMLISLQIGSFKCLCANRSHSC